MNMRGCALALLITTALSGCDDQIKRVPIFKTLFFAPNAEPPKNMLVMITVSNFFFIKVLTSS